MRHQAPILVYTSPIAWHWHESYSSECKCKNENKSVQIKIHTYIQVIFIPIRAKRLSAKSRANPTCSTQSGSEMHSGQTTKEEIQTIVQFFNQMEKYEYSRYFGLLEYTSKLPLDVFRSKSTFISLRQLPPFCRYFVSIPVIAICLVVVFVTVFLILELQVPTMSHIVSKMQPFEIYLKVVAQIVKFRPEFQLCRFFNLITMRGQRENTVMLTRQCQPKANILYSF